MDLAKKSQETDLPKAGFARAILTRDIREARTETDKTAGLKRYVLAGSLFLLGGSEADKTQKDFFRGETYEIE
jgi:hypothetical protein